MQELISKKLDSLSMTQPVPAVIPSPRNLLKQHLTGEVKNSEESSDHMMSDADDKEDPNYFKRDAAYYRLPSNVRQAVANRQMRSKHSDFYYKL